MNSPYPSVIGVVGAGIMGAGIAQLAASAGMSTRLHDPVPDALAHGVAQVEAALARLTAKGRISRDDANTAMHRLHPTADLAQLSACEFVIEAAPERLELKLELFGALDDVVTPECVLATNTSSLSVTELAAATREPGRVVGLHFFNPAPVMPLVEVVAGQASGPEALSAAHAVGVAMGKRVIDTVDTPGFVVNRCNRPYSLEALRLLEARVGTIDQIDRIARMGGGFRMGPFELMDLIGLETNHAVAEGLFRQTYWEPRYQPSPLQARMIAAGRLGRKTRAGWYDYWENGATRDTDPEPLPGGGGEGRLVLVTGALSVAADLRTRLHQADFDVITDLGEATPWLTVVCGNPPADATGPRVRLLAHASLHGSDPEAAGFHLLPPLDDIRLIEVASTPRTDPVSFERLCELARALGWRYEHVGDAPGLVLGRIVCQLINEAAFLIGAGIAGPEDVDAGLELGVNHPRGPVAWSAEIGIDHVVSVLDGLRAELGEDRYRVAPLLRQSLAVGERGLNTAAGPRRG